MIGLDVLGFQVTQPVVAKRFYDAPGPPPVTVQRSGPDPGGYVVFQPGIKEGLKGILAGSYVKPAVHLVQDLGQPAFGTLIRPRLRKRYGARPQRSQKLVNGEDLELAVGLSPISISSLKGALLGSFEPRAPLSLLPGRGSLPSVRPVESPPSICRSGE